MDFRKGDKVTVLKRLVQGEPCKGVILTSYPNGQEAEVEIPPEGIVDLTDRTLFDFCELAHGHNVRIEGEEIPERNRKVDIPQRLIKWRGAPRGKAYLYLPEDLADQLEAWIKENS